MCCVHELEYAQYVCVMATGFAPCSLQKTWLTLQEYQTVKGNVKAQIFINYSVVKGNRVPLNGRSWSLANEFVCLAEKCLMVILH